MKIKGTYLVALVLSFFCVHELNAEKAIILKSPNQKLLTNVMVGNNVSYSVEYEGNVVLERSFLSMTLQNGIKLGENVKLVNSSIRNVNHEIAANFYKKDIVKDDYNELVLKCKGNYYIIFRAYDKGLAYRFVYNTNKPFAVMNENASFNFPEKKDIKAYIPYVRSIGNSLENQFSNSFENTYKYISLSEWDKRRLAFSPVVFEEEKGIKVCLSEADLINYPGMFLYNGKGTNSVTGVFANYPKEIEQGGHNMLEGVVKSREPYIAKFDKGTDFPWRVINVSSKDYELADNDMTYRLASPNKIADCSWIKPGKTAWDWWNGWNLYGVNFRAGINNDTYKYYIDFASKNKIEYVILDEGWAVNLKADLMQVIPEIDLKELVDYAKSKNVGIILWAGYYAFARDIENVCKHYSEMGVKGFKIDFMNRDDQPMVNFQYRAAEIAAKYHMILDFHGTFKPAGLNRTFPNVLNFEGVHGLEQMKWSKPDVDQVTYDVTLPYTRMVAGPMDYTQGAMRNATKDNYQPVYSEAMSQGTRCHQLAEYIIFESPFSMLCDSPSNYERESECSQFISTVPTVWDNTQAINGEIAKYITIARQKGNDWYLGSMTDWNARDLKIDLSFLGKGNYKVEIFKDGINADRAARDYVHEFVNVPADRMLKIHLAPGGGFVAHFYK